MGKETNYTFDAGMELKDSYALTASAAAQVDSAAKVIYVGSGMFEGDAVIDVTAMDIASNDEVYDLVMQGSPDAAFGTAGNIHDLATLNLSAKEVKRTDSDKDDVIGRYVLPFRNEANGVFYPYIRLYHAISGTTPSITDSAFIGKRKR